MTRAARRLTGLALTALIVVGGSACKLKKAQTHDPSGPSELGLSLTIHATPDTLTMNGRAKATIRVTARNANGQPQANVALRFDITKEGVIFDHGKLSAKQAVTGADGVATVTYTAPEGAPQGNTDPVIVVTLLVTPIGTDYANALFRSVNLRLVPRGVILPPNTAPTASFTFSPSTPGEDDEILFDASASSDPDGTIVRYDWTLGDGRTKQGVQVRHVYGLRDTYVVTLTVTDDRGETGTATQEVSIEGSGDPVAVFSVSPASPMPNEKVVLNGMGSTAAPGRTITHYFWTLGDGNTGTGGILEYRYKNQGSFTVTLTVTDSEGRTGTSTGVVSVGEGAEPDLNFVWSPQSPTVGQQVIFNAEASQPVAGRTFTSYDWNFGNGKTASGPVVPTSFSQAGTYNVVLVVTDNLGVVFRVTDSITIAP